MKKLLLISFLLLQLSQSEAQSWIYHPFPDSLATWNVSYQEYGVGYCGEYSYTFSGDTLINGVTYQKVLKTGHDFSMTFTPSPFPTWNCNHSVMYSNYTVYAAAIKEDMLQKKIYVVAPSDTLVQLLYDFNMNVGDSLKGYLSLCDGCSKVASVDSILIGGTYRKQWNMQMGTDVELFHIIEGIGSSAGLLNIVTHFEYYSNLDCFSQNDQTLYPYYISSAGCALLTSKEELSETENNFRLYPNPTTGKFQITSDQKVEMIEIMDVLGNTVYRSAVNNIISELDLSVFPSAVYFAIIKDKNGTFSVQKLLKN
jgi:hypothetical protein